MAAEGDHPPKVFISYSHDSDQHRSRVLALSDGLRKQGIDCNLDQYEPTPKQGWPRWMTGQIKTADFVLMICTANYYRRVMGQDQPGTGMGVTWEGQLIYQQLYDSGTSNDKFIPLLFESGDREHIPDPLRGYTSYCVGKEDDELYRRLTSQPATASPPLGSLDSLEQRAQVNPKGIEDATQRFLALLFTDLVDSMRMQESLGEHPAARVKKRHHELARGLFKRYGGREVDDTGDGFLVAFDQPYDAVRFALEFHAELEHLSDELNLEVDNKPFRLNTRVGVSFGNVVIMEDSIDAADNSTRAIAMDGLPIGIANRVMSAALGGQTLMTVEAFNFARRSAKGTPTEAKLVWLQHGSFSLQGIDAPQTICEVGIKGRSPLRPPLDSNKVKRIVTPVQDDPGPWRPAKALAVPHNPHWILLEHLGSGGFGEVWLAQNKSVDIQRVFKFCFDADRLRALKRELSIFKLLRGALGEHANIQRLNDVHIQEPPPYYVVMDYARGGNLASWSASEQYGGIGNVPMGDRLELVAQIADGLGAAHAVGVIHKDVKPGNILIDHEPGHGIQARLADFGIGIVIAPELPEQLGIHMTGWETTDLGSDLGSRTGTRLYTAPELVAGRDPSIQSDIYSLGVVLYQVVIGDFGQPLAEGWKEGIADELLREDIELCVHGDPKRRLRAAEDLAERLRTLEKRRRDKHDRQVEAERVRDERERRERLIRRLRRVAIGFGLAIPIAILVTVLVVAWRAEWVQRQAQEVLTTLFTDPVAAQDKLNRGGERLRAIVGELGSAYLHSTEPFPRLGARLWSFLPEPLAASFWSSVDGGALWRHGGWLELCSEEPSAQRMPFAQLEEKIRSGKEKEKYVAFCLIGHYSPTEEKWRDLCMGAIENEAHPGVIAAARWAAQRLGADVTMKSSERVYVDEVTGLTFVHVSGTDGFSPGSLESEFGRWSKSEGRPTTPEPVPDLWVSMTEVTWELVARLKREDRSKFPEDLRNEVASKLAGLFEAVPEDQDTWDKIALTSVSFFQAELMSALFSGLEGNGNPNRYRLPSEAEWEYICRSGSAASFCFGNNPLYAGYFAVCDGEQPSEPFAVAKRMPSFYGVFDMHGNAWELCHTYYRDSYNDPEPDPIHMAEVRVVVRGGALYSPALRCRSAQRNWTRWNVADPRTGFRLVLERPEK